MPPRPVGRGDSFGWTGGAGFGWQFLKCDQASLRVTARMGWARSWLLVGCGEAATLGVGAVQFMARFMELMRVEGWGLRVERLECGWAS